LWQVIIIIIFLLKSVVALWSFCDNAMQPPIIVLHSMVKPTQ